MRFRKAILLTGAAVTAACASDPSVRTDKSAAAFPPAAPVFTLADVERATPAELDALFGAPALTRREGAGEFRRYALSACSLIVVLYPDETGEIKTREISASALRAGEANPALADCLAAG